MFASLIMKDYTALKAAIQTRTRSEVSYLAGGKNQIKILKWFPLFNLIEHHYLAEDCPALGVGVEVGWDCTGRKETGRVKAVAHAHVPARAHTQTDRQKHRNSTDSDTQTHTHKQTKQTER